MKKARPLTEIEPFAEGELLNVVIETARGGGSKFKYDPVRDLFTLHFVLAKGYVFPYDYGFIPSTLGEDGDPLDIVVLMDAAVFPGCLVHARLVGAIEAVQKEQGRSQGHRNDRLLAVEAKCPAWGGAASLADLSKALVDQIENFFVDYNRRRGREFIPQGRCGADRALLLVQEGVRRFRKTAS